MMTIPKRYSIGYNLDKEFLDDLEEETEMVYEACRDDLDEKGTAKMLNLLEKYYNGEYTELKTEINQPCIYYMLDSYIQLEIYDKAKECYFRIYDNTHVNVRAVIINIALKYNSGGAVGKKKLAKFINLLVYERSDKLKSYFFAGTIYIAMKNTDQFTDILIKMAKEFGVNDETKPIYSKFKTMCKDMHILVDIRAAIREVRDTEKLDVIKELYAVM
jgi:hypothetical protein